MYKIYKNVYGFIYKKAHNNLSNFPLRENQISILLYVKFPFKYDLI